MRLHSRKQLSMFIALAGAASLFLLPPALGMQRLKMNPQMAMQIRAATEAQAKANEELFSQMRIVAAKLKSIRRQIGSYPLSQPDMDVLFQDTGALGTNPFKDAAGDQTRGASDVREIVINTLADEDIDGFLASPPDDWQGEPGTFLVATNTYDRFILLGFGCDRRVMRDSDGQVRAIIGKRL